MSNKIKQLQDGYRKLIDHCKGFNDTVSAYRDGNTVIVNCDVKIHNKILVSELISAGWVNNNKCWTYTL